MIMTKKQVTEVTQIFDGLSDSDLLDTLVTLRVLIVLDAIKPADKALFSNDLLTHELFRRGLTL